MARRSAGKRAGRCALLPMPIKWHQKLTGEFGTAEFEMQGGTMNIRETAPRITELEKISTRTDTRDYLAKASPPRKSSRTGWSSMSTPT